MPARGLFVTSLCVTALFFGWIAFYGFFFSDDFTWLWHGKKLLADLPAIFSAHMSSFYSPVVNAFFTLLFPLFGTWAPGYYLVNLCVHVLVSWLCGMLLWRMTQSKASAYAATILAALAGSAYEPIVWISSNLHSIATLCILSACIAYSIYLETKKIRFATLCVVATALAFLTKEIAIVTPLLLALTGILQWHASGKKRMLDRSHALLAACIALLTIAYGYQEYEWQRSGLTVASGLWSVDMTALSRYPYALLQMLAPVERMITASNAFWALLSGLLGWVILLLLSRTRPLILFGSAWIAVSLLPVIFFSDPENPFFIASRYTYLARIGLIFALIGILSPLLSPPRRAKKTAIAVIALALVSLPHLGVTYARIATEYAYVYTTGRTLVSALEILPNDPLDTLYVSPDRPFDKNDAAIVGAASIVADFPESRIVFLKKNEQITLGPRDVLLAWDYKKLLFTLSRNTEP